MKILFTQETDWLRRNPAQQHHLAELLSLRGHEIRVIDYEILWRTEGKKELHSRREIFDSVYKIHKNASVTLIRPAIIKLPLLHYISLLFSHRKEIRRQINEFKPDLIVGWGILNSYLAIKAARKNNIPFLYYWIDTLDRLIPFRPFQLIGKLVESKVLRQSDRILTINDRLRDYVLRLGAQQERTKVLRAGIYTKQFNPNINYSSLRKQYRLNEKDIVLFFMGWLYNFSGIKEVATRLAQNQNTNLKLLVTGEGDAHKELQQIRNRYKIQDRIVITGQKTYQEIPSLIGISDICLLPAYPDEKIMQDIVPIKMYEYMVMGKPVIATRLPGIMKEFGEDSGVVYVNRPEDVISKAAEMVQNGSAVRLGLKARSFAEQHDWHTITDGFEEILKEVVREETK
ncbi:glycosyltransferase [Chloroflexota bacterium]